MSPYIIKAEQKKKDSLVRWTLKTNNASLIYKKLYLKTPSKSIGVGSLYSYRN